MLFCVAGVVAVLVACVGRLVWSLVFVAWLDACVGRLFDRLFGRLCGRLFGSWFGRCVGRCAARCAAPGRFVLCWSSNTSSTGKEPPLCCKRR